MKNRTFLKAVILLMLVLASADIIAQDYVVPLKTDTIRGKVKPLFSGRTAKVQITTSDNKKINYDLFEVRGFSFKNEIYHPVKGPNGYTFMKLIRAGYLSYYAFQLQNQVTFDGFYLTKMDGTGMEVPNLGFKKAMTKFLSECDSVVIKIDNGDFGKRDIEKIVVEYNICVDNKTANQAKQIMARADQGKK